MNKFVTLARLMQFNKVAYYSVKVNDADDSLFLQFLNSNSENVEQLSIIRTWLKKLGEEIGAQEQYFRNEAFRGGDAKALPPPASFINVDCRLRLYCMRVNTNSVILFNGAIKTAETAQECDSVRPHFLFANQLTKAIDKAIFDKDIQVDVDKGTLIYDDDLIIEI